LSVSGLLARSFKIRKRERRKIKAHRLPKLRQNRQAGGKGYWQPNC